MTLSSGENLILSRADGSFLANLGWLNIQGAAVRGSATTNLGAPAFRPFVLTAGQGSLTATDASFAHLGFGDAPRFGGVSVDNSGLRPPQTPPVIARSAFDDVKTIALISTRFATVSANTVTQGSLVISHSHNAFVAGNFVNGAETAALRITNFGQKRQTRVRVCALEGSIDEAFARILTRKVETIRTVMDNRS